MRPVGSRCADRPDRPLPVSRTGLEIKVSTLARTPGICKTDPGGEGDRRGAGAMWIGYAGVSILEQDLDVQYEALKTPGCEEIYRQDRRNQGRTARPRPGPCRRAARRYARGLETRPA